MRGAGGEAEGDTGSPVEDIWGGLSQGRSLTSSPCRPRGVPSSGELLACEDAVSADAFSVGTIANDCYVMEIAVGSSKSQRGKYKGTIFLINEQTEESPVGISLRFSPKF